ncbi:FAD-binding and (Fe-S)-binding domain-containing protein [Rhodococcus artemisiae]|uniref:FAD-binding and (Fe-S)-binding domain-containing protein n=1 Tax=Rhodococcus artemisiae TaxID=714159 RepID=A0ABU7LFT2_9NOCA|nr:FAD-binding and (Fe-S)-binding domain-containing protein [Rhodococcus artemisiae]
MDSDLQASGIRVDRSNLARALYTSDAGLYRIAPQGVVSARTAEDVEAVVAAAIEHRVSLTARGAGTSCAGNAIGSGVILEMHRYLDAVVAVDAEAHTATVQPGVVQADLQAAAAPHGLRFGPDPSTSNRCTIGGMIGNNACGPRALGYGRTADNVVALEAVLGTGERVRLESGGAPPPSVTLDALRGLVNENLAVIRTEFGRFKRQVSGYSLEHLLPENGFDVAKFLAGTEGTLAVITEATVRLVADAPHKRMVVLGYPTMADAADDAPDILRHLPTAAEGLDRRIVDVVANQPGAGALPVLPAGDGWVFVELVDDDDEVLSRRAEALVRECAAVEGWVVDDPKIAAALWKIRADGAGLAESSLAEPAYGGWEDAAVPPERLGDYLRDFDTLLAAHGMHGLPYGHFGDGCVHCRIDFPLGKENGPERYRAFVEEAADLVGRYGGSLSGEHGDGRARSALLTRMYSSEAVALMAEVKDLLDPHGVLNPGIIVDPDPVHTQMRVPSLLTRPLTITDRRFVDEVHRCSGVGKCLAGNGSAGQVMCPSYQATGREQDSTRGRARVLQEMVGGDLIGGWDSPEVAGALDLCLSCKGCSSDCPRGVDMASYKSIVLDEAHRGRIRPRSHYMLGRLPRWGRLVTALRLGALVNAGSQNRLLGKVVRWSAGVDRRRSLPRFASKSTRRSTAVPSSPGTPVAVWVDSFTDSFEGAGLSALIDVLVDAGYAPRFVEKNACCGLTWISTGQREGARKQLSASLDVLHPIASAGIPIVGVEPSCTAVWRSDAAELLPDDERVATVAAHVFTLAEVLTKSPDWEPPDLRGVSVIAQPHCHHTSVLGWAADAALLARAGAEVRQLGGCCGLAGNFGVEKGHYETSVAVAELTLLPAVREADAGTVVLADGFSCRLQLEELAGRTAVTLAQLLASGRVDNGRSAE